MLLDPDPIVKKASAFIAKRCLGPLLAFVVLIYFVRQLMVNISEIPPIQWYASSYIAVATCLAICLANILITGFVWHTLLKLHNTNFSIRTAQSILLISQFAKYLPGNVGHHIGRVLIAKKNGIPVLITLNAMATEIIWVVIVSASLGLAGLISMDINDSGLSTPNLFAVLILLALLPFLPTITTSLIHRYASRLLERLFKTKHIPHMNLSSSLYIAMLYLGCFILNGAVLKLHAMYLFSSDVGTLYEFVVFFAIAWLAGFLVPGAPGGLGIREAVLLHLFTPITGLGIALGLSVTMRITTTIADGFGFVLGLMLSPHKENS
jgi:hypothetical protein